MYIFKVNNGLVIVTVKISRLSNGKRFAIGKKGDYHFEFDILRY